MEHKWLGAGLLAMGVAGLVTLWGPGRCGEGCAAAARLAEDAAAGETRVLPQTPAGGGMGLYGALEGRRSDRNFAADGEIGEEVLSRLLWAASGINRRDGRLTVPTALDSRDLRVFVLDVRGVWLYLPEAHALVCRRGGDWRKASGKQRYTGKAAVNLVYAVDLSLQARKGIPEEAIAHNAMFEAGCAAQNVALACVSEGLKNVVRGSWSAEELAGALDLPEGWRILIAQSVGP